MPALQLPSKRTAMVPNTPLFELEIHEDSDEPGQGRGDHVALADLVAQVRDYTRALGTFEAELAQDVQDFSSQLHAEEGRVDAVVLASKLAAVGYRVAIRTAVGGGLGQEAFSNLSHTFLIITKGDLHLTDYLIDPSFREQFSITARDAAFDALLGAVPESFVGTKERLIPLVQLLASEMAAAFDACAVTCPPWRSYRSMLSKWVPAKKRDLELPRQQSGLGGLSPTSTLTPPGASPPPFVWHDQDSLSVRAHSADLLPSSRTCARGALSQLPHGHSQPVSGNWAAPTCACFAPLQSREGFEVNQKIEAVGGPRHSPPQHLHKGVPTAAHRQQQHYAAELLHWQRSGAVDVSPRGHRQGHAWQHQPNVHVVKLGGQQVQRVK